MTKWSAFVSMTKAVGSASSENEPINHVCQEGTITFFFFLFYRWRNWGLNDLTELYKLTKLVSDRNRTQTSYTFWQYISDLTAFSEILAPNQDLLPQEYSWPFPFLGKLEKSINRVHQMSSPGDIKAKTAGPLAVWEGIPLSCNILRSKSGHSG